MFLVTLLLALIIFILAFLITVGIFLVYSMKSGKKYTTITFVAVIFVIAFLIRAACVCSIANWNFSSESFTDGLVRSLELIYVTGGGLTFEGQNPLYTETGFAAVATLFYYGSILWLASTYIFIISLGLNYELNSRIRLFFLRHDIPGKFNIFSRIKNYKKAKAAKNIDDNEKLYFNEEIFIFTAITDDALILARDIEKHSQKKKRKKPIIVFAGYDIPPYDKDNDLHREIMMNGYIYQSFYKSKINEEDKPLLALLKFPGSKKSTIGSLYNRRVNIFSLGNNSNNAGYESQNSDITFNDMNAILNIDFSKKKIAKKIKEGAKDEYEAKERILIDVLKKNVEFEKTRNKKYDYSKPGLVYLKYYVLSNSTVNHEFYDKKKSELLEEWFGEKLLNKRINITKDGVSLCDDKKKCSVYEFFKLLFQTKVINESYLSGIDLVKKRMGIQIESIKGDAQNYLKNGERRYRYPINRVKTLVDKNGKKRYGDTLPVETFIKGELSKLGKEVTKEAFDKYYVKHIESINENNHETTFRTLILGFGQTGQMALNNLYVNTASVEPEFIKDENGNEIQTERYVPSRFIAHVFDLNIHQTLGVFAQTHPSYLVKKVDISSIGKGKLESEDKESKMFYNLANLHEFYKVDYPGKFAEIDELIKFPFVYGYQMNCKDISFLEIIDEITGNIDKQKRSVSLGKINSIVVALGDDEENIKVANGIIQSLRQELYNDDPVIYKISGGISKEESAKVMDLLNARDEVRFVSITGEKLYVVYRLGSYIREDRLNELLKTVIENDKFFVTAVVNKQYFHQTIFVNIRDEKNLLRLNWRDGIEEINHRGVYVRTFGNRKDLYSYDAIIGERRAINFQSYYRSVDEYFNRIDAFSLETSQVVDLMLDESKRQEIIDIINNITKNKKEAKRSYLNLIAYKKESNVYASQFSNYYESFLDVIGVDTLYKDREIFKYLALLEHNRWARYCISIGYVYSSTFAVLYGPYRKKEGSDFDIYKKYGFEDARDYMKGFLKLHTDIVPYSYGDRQYLPKIAEIYDYANALFPSLKKMENK